MALARVHVELDHHCEHCGKISPAGVMGRGSGDDRHGDGKFHAEVNAHRDAAALIRLTRCPHCHLRNPTAVRALWKRAAWVLAGFGALGAVVFALADQPFGLAFLRLLLWGPFGVALLIGAATVALLSVRDLRGSRLRVKFLLPGSADQQGPYRSRE